MCKIDSKAVDHECNTEDTSKTINLSNNRICWSPVLKLKRFDEDINNCIKKKSAIKSDSKIVNNNIKHNPEIYTVKKTKLAFEDKIIEIINPKEYIIENVNQNKQTTKEKTKNKTKKIWESSNKNIPKNFTLLSTKKNKIQKY